MLKFEKPFVIPVFIPHSGCPHQCIFCNQSQITGMSKGIPPKEKIISEIEQFLGYKKDASRHTQIAYYGGNFLGLEKDDLCLLLETASHFVTSGSVDSIRFSTRPDTINEDILSFLKPYPVTTIELNGRQYSFPCESRPYQL